MPLDDRAQPFANLSSSDRWLHAQAIARLCLAKTPPQLNLLLVTCYTTCLYVVHSKRALNSGEAHLVHLSFGFLNVADFKGIRAG